jgi:hypothetical protein
MPIHMGIMCEQCRKVHFIATSSGIQFSRSGGGIYQLKCPPPCATTRQFHEYLMLPYRVADHVFRRGYAEEREYELVPSERRTLHYLTAHG